MLKKFAVWFIVFGFSFLVSNVFGWTEQGKAFLYTHIGVTVIITLVLILVFVIAGNKLGFSAESNVLTFLMLFTLIVMVAIALFATWGATKLFDVDFYVTYQIMTFGQCLCPDNKRKNEQ